MSWDLQSTRPLLYFLTLLSIIVEKVVCCAAIENQRIKNPEPSLHIYLMTFSNLLHLYKGFFYTYSHYCLGLQLEYCSWKTHYFSRCFNAEKSQCLVFPIQWHKFYFHCIVKCDNHIFSSLLIHGAIMHLNFTDVFRVKPLLLWSSFASFAINFRIGNNLFCRRLSKSCPKSLACSPRPSSISWWMLDNLLVIWSANTAVSIVNS